MTFIKCLKIDQPFFDLVVFALESQTLKSFDLHTRDVVMVGGKD